MPVLNQCFFILSSHLNDANAKNLLSKDINLLYPLLFDRKK